MSGLKPSTLILMHVLAVDTVCSSSLVSTHLAARALSAGDCELALSAGINLLLVPETSAMCQAAGMLSADGRCKALDAAADGYGRSETAGALLLAPWASNEAAEASPSRGGSLSEAAAAPLLLIAGTAVNQDGRSSSLTAPNGPAQQVRQLWLRLASQHGV
jgi:acyl transferase domain-containing protein